MEREETIKDSQLCTEMDVDTNPQIPLKDSQIAKITKKPRSRSSDFTEESEIIAKDSNFKTQEKRLTKQERIELGKSFQKAINSRDWPKSEELISSSDLQTLNDLLCIAVDLIWFLTLREELQEITGLIRKIVNNGANDFTRATLRTSFLASCVSACQGRNVSLPDAVNIMGQRLHERLEECHGDDMLKTEVTCKVKKFTEWALRCIGSHHSQRNPKDPRKPAPEISTVEVQRQLAAFKLFLDLADCQLSGKDYTEAFDAACFPLTLFNSGEWTGDGLSEGQWTGGGLSEGEWTGGGCGKVVEGMLEMLVEGGADNVNQCFLEASRFGSTQLVKILLQIAQRNSLDIDVDLALGFASHYDKLQTMSFLVDSAGATGFVGPLMRAAERGALTVVKFFVSRGCRHVELCLALAAAAAACRFGVVEFLLPVVPKDVLGEFGRQVINASSSASRCSHGNNSLSGVEFLLKSDFLSDAEATYNVANSIARSTDDEGFSSELKSFLAENWSEEAYQKGVRTGEEHFVNLTRILERGEEVSVGLGDLPRELVVSIAYLGLYRECVKNGGPLLNQRLRGELVEAVRRLNGGRVDRNWESKELLAILERHLPWFFI